LESAILFSRKGLVELQSTSRFSAGYTNHLDEKYCRTAGRQQAHPAVTIVSRPLTFLGLRHLIAGLTAATKAARIDFPFLDAPKWVVADCLKVNQKQFKLDV
jgi:hypothetical protein